MKKEIKQNKYQISHFKELDDGLDPYVLAKQVVIKGERRQIFVDFVRKIREKMPIHSKIEEEFLKTYIFSAWKLRRLREIERIIFNGQQKIAKINYAEYGIPEEKGPVRRIRDLSRVYIDDRIKENNAGQDKLKKEMARVLKQLRDEQNATKTINK